MRYQCYQYLNQHNLLNEKQFGFRPKHSTISAVSSFADEILLNMERGKLCGAVFLDLSKAFDTVDLTNYASCRLLGQLLTQLKGLSRILMDECNVHLAVRNCLICQAVTHGMRQGSILGPLLFLVYVDDLPAVIKHSQEANYADDAVLYWYDSNPAGLECALNADLHASANWLHDNKLALNVGKTKSMLIQVAIPSYIVQQAFGFCS